LNPLIEPVSIHREEQEVPALFDQSTQDDLTNEEFRAEKAAVLVKILWTRHGLDVAKVNGGLRPAS
jgi:hypothetical protein